MFRKSRGRASASCLAAILLQSVWTAPAAGEPKQAPAASGSAVVLGTTQAVFDELARANLGEQSSYTFRSTSREEIQATIESYSLNEGRLSMSGSAGASSRSRFILKGTRERLYGWVALQERNVAYEYTTDTAGRIVVQAVPLTKIYPVCNLPKASHGSSSSDYPRLGRQQGPEPHIGEYPGTDLAKLQSLPGAAKVLYLDISEVMNGDTPINFAKEEMWKAWQSVASCYSMYQFNVTTDKSVYDAAGVTNSGIAKFINTDERAYCSLDAFGTTEFCHVFTGAGAESTEGYGVGRTSCHELGHLLGLSHDGSPADEYFVGFAEFKWAPMMGNYYPGNGWGDEALYQWSKGEYADANNNEDDFDIMARAAEFRADDVPGAVPLVLSGTMVSPESNRGQIGGNADSDEFTFAIASGGGHAKLTVDRTEYMGGGALDVTAAIRDASMAILAENNETASRAATLDADLPEGSYTLVVKGGNEGTPSEGFSNYGSMGFYAIEGTIDGGMGTGGVGGSAGTGGSGGSAGSGGAGGSAGTSGTGGSAGAGGTAGTGIGGGAGTAGGAGGGGVSGSAGMGVGGTTGGSAGTGGSGNAGAGGTGVAPNPGTDEGCGCRVTSGSRSTASALLLAALVAWRKRRRPRTS